MSDRPSTNDKCVQCGHAERLQFTIFQKICDFLLIVAFAISVYPTICSFDSLNKKLHKIL